MNTPFDFKTTYDGETVRITGSVAPYFPTVGPSMSDPGSPAEGGEIEDFRAYAEDGTEIEDADEILSALDDEIREKIADGAVQDQADAADAKSDREKEG